LIKLRRVWRYQRGNQNSYIDEQTTQWPKEKVQKDKQWSTQHTHKTKDRVTRTPLKIWSELRCSERISSSCSTSGTRRVNLVNQSFIYVLDSNSFCHVYPPDIERDIHELSDPSQMLVVTSICFVGGFIKFKKHLCTYYGFKDYFHIRWCSCRLIVRQRRQLVEQDLLVLPEFVSGFSGTRIAQTLVFV
jgi:hypothetical protein